MKFQLFVTIDVDTDGPVTPTYQHNLAKGVERLIAKKLELGEPRIDDQARFAFVAVKAEIKDGS